MIKERTTIRVSGTPVNGNAATLDFTSDPIFLKEVWDFTVSFFFDSLTITGQQPPTLTIEESNSADVDSFIPIQGWTDVNLPEFFKDFKTEAEYIRLVYDSQGATSGTIEIQARILK